eukprot:TRINITY_DN3025_c0_g1_i3.p1 TRINITY_DN3025_c0_g1~~TRINITY_DN3025_c0_g1_i3.p1  ORF type:complete len:295 (-),score=70.12 TRINITY_DN3025_c0_g1_i3:118-1002(-)
MDEIIFDNDDYFLPNGDEESIWQIMDTIIIEKNDNEPNKRTISEISNNNHHINQNNNIPIKKENINAKKLKAEIEIPKSVLETNNDEVIFFSNTKDPFAQTVWMVLLEKKIPFKYIEIPAIKFEETVIYDSNILNEFMEDFFQDKINLLPKDPHEKAKARLLIKKIQELIPPFNELLQAQTLETQKHRGLFLKKKLKEVNDFLYRNSPTSDEGPYLLGNDFSLLDCVLLPFYDRMTVVLPVMRSWKIPNTHEFKLLEKWYFRASKRLSFQETRKINNVKYEEYLLKEYQSGGII